MKTSISLRANKHYVKKSGVCQLYFYVKINSESFRLPLEIEWPPELVNIENNELAARHKDDKECADLNLIIREAISKANNIFIEHRLSGQPLDSKRFLDIYRGYEKRRSFLDYYEKTMWDRYRRGKISESTRKSHNNALIWLKKYKKEILFEDLTTRFIENFESFLRKEPQRRGESKQLLNHNSVANVMKYVKAYINQAISKEKIPIANPFTGSDVKTSQDRKQVDYLDASEVKQLMAHYATDIPIGDKLTLCRFLIACILGLRISDILKTKPSMVEEWNISRKLAFHPKKQVRTKRLKTIYLPIDDIAMGYLNDLVALNKQTRLEGKRISDAYARKTLKKIAVRNGISRDINFHTGRHTFATNYLRAGGKLTNLQAILGHSNITTTMIYAHIVDSDKEEEMAKLTNFYLLAD